MNRLTLYMAGPLFTSAEVAFNAKLASELRLYYGVNLPQEMCKELSHPVDIMRVCRRGIDDAHVVLVNCDGPDVDSGTAWEAGYAHARAKKIIAYRTDFRRAGDCDDDANLMIAMNAYRFLKAYNGVVPWTVQTLAINLVEAIG